MARERAHRTRQAPDRTDDMGVHPLRPLRLSTDEAAPPPGWSDAKVQRPEPIQEPFQAPELPRLPYGLFFALGMVAVVLFVGFELGGGFDPPPAPAAVAPAVDELVEVVQAPQPREVITQFAERRPTPPPSAAAASARRPAPTPAASRPEAPADPGNPVGRWEGTLGGRQVIVDLRGRPGAFRGTVTSYFLSNSMEMAVSGAYDPGSRTLAFEDLDPEPDAGRYWGTVSDDGQGFDGWFERLDGTSRVPLILHRKG